MEKNRNYIFYYANKNDKVFLELSRIYWRNKLSEILEYLDKNLLNPTIILFGSLSKAETKNNSDVDLCILAHKKELNLTKFEKKLKRKIQLFFFNSIDEIKNKELANNIVNGHIINGRIRI